MLLTALVLFLLGGHSFYVLAFDPIFLEKETCFLVVYGTLLLTGAPILGAVDLYSTVPIWMWAIAIPNLVVCILAICRVAFIFFEEIFS